MDCEDEDVKKEGEMGGSGVCVSGDVRWEDAYDSSGSSRRIEEKDREQRTRTNKAKMSVHSEN